MDEHSSVAAIPFVDIEKREFAFRISKGKEERRFSTVTQRFEQERILDGSGCRDNRLVGVKEMMTIALLATHDWSKGKLPRKKDRIRQIFVLVAEEEIFGHSHRIYNANECHLPGFSRWNRKSKGGPGHASYWSGCVCVTMDRWKQ